MKKIIIMAAACLAGVLAVNAQTYSDTYINREDSLQYELDRRDAQIRDMAQREANSKIWGKGRYTNIGFSIAQTGTKFEKEVGQFGFSLTKGTTYLFPKQPFWNILKVGFDVNWVDVSFAKYKSTDTDWDNAFEGSMLPDEMQEFEDMLNIGRWGVLVGAFGIGPNVTVAPFSTFDNAARYLKASLYFHYQPTFGMYLRSEDGDMEGSYAYCNMFQFGGKITWKFIGLGIEGHWGSGNFKNLSFEDNEFQDWFGEKTTGSDKIRRKFANTRIYLSLIF